MQTLENGPGQVTRGYYGATSHPTSRRFGWIVIGMLVSVLVLSAMAFLYLYKPTPPKVVMRYSKIEWQRTDRWSGGGEIGFSTYPVEYIPAKFVGESRPNKETYQSDSHVMKNLFDDKPKRTPGFELDPIVFETEYGTIRMNTFFMINEDYLIARLVVKDGEWRTYLMRRGDQWVNIPYPGNLIKPIHEKAVDKMLNGDTIPKEQALTEWKSAGGKVMYILHGYTSSYHDSELQEWSLIKHHGGGDWPVLEDNGKWIKSGMMKEGKFKILYFKKSDLTTDWDSTEWAKSQGGKPTQVDLLD